VAVALVVAVPGTSVGVVAGGTGRAMVTVPVWISVGFAGGGVWVAMSGVRVKLPVAVCVTSERREGVRVTRGDSAAGVGVSKKTPGTTGSPTSGCPSSRRITSSTAGFMGATFSKGQRP
jgi:hypothetical protein